MALEQARLAKEHALSLENQHVWDAILARRDKEQEQEQEQEHEQDGLLAPVVLEEDEVRELAKLNGLELPEPVLVAAPRPRTASTSSSTSSSIVSEVDSLLSVDSIASSVSTAPSATGVKHKKDDFPALSSCALPAALDFPISSSTPSNEVSSTLFNPIDAPAEPSPASGVAVEPTSSPPPSPRMSVIWHHLRRRRRHHALQPVYLSRAAESF
ncbi:hypothetical protein JCM8547_002845 [Rhodosporidiobolus lusitaniae]